MRYSSSAHTRFYHRFHVVWVTKYRYKLLQGAMRDRTPGFQAIAPHRKRVRVFSMVELVNAREQEKAQGKAGKIAEAPVKPDLVILDEPGYLPFSASGGALLFHLLSKPWFQDARSAIHRTYPACCAGKLNPRPIKCRAYRPNACKADPALGLTGRVQPVCQIGSKASPPPKSPWQQTPHQALPRDFPLERVSDARQ